ncbi:MAG: PspC domain-containing protein, partial [Ornithinimicrobium sp.]
MNHQPVPSRPALARPTRGRVIGGVAAGLADHLELRVGLVRVTFVLLGGVSGAGVAAYVFLWGLLPQVDAEDGPTGVTVRGQAERSRGKKAASGSTRAAMGRAGWLMV